ncbi:MAG: CtsR family transcriptional regulator [Clostridia bacterium]|nr:CtsR family transcriptional regulator [Clostridia bacterium]MBQ6646340.1 CtsR family transcriptional regulator [Clostridia bacterium]
MAALSDNIERFIKDLLTDDTRVELKRNELAQYFGCANSQINYVLATRFSVDRGYLVESRRGGSGYVRVIRISTKDVDLLSNLLERIGTQINEEDARAIILRLYELKLVSANEARLMQAAVSQDAINIPISSKDALRASVLKSVIVQAFKNLREGE